MIDFRLVGLGFRQGVSFSGRSVSISGRSVSISGRSVLISSNSENEKSVVLSAALKPVAALDLEPRSKPREGIFEKKSLKRIDTLTPYS